MTKDEFKRAQADKGVCPVCGGIGGHKCNDRTKEQRAEDKKLMKRRARRVLKVSLKDADIS